MVNYIALTGKMEHDPEVQYCGHNHDQPQASFTLAFETGNNRTGRIRVSCFGRLAKLVERYLHQGARLTVAGVLDQQEDLTADEQEKSGFRLMARSLEVIATDRRGHTSFTPLESSLPGQRPFGARPQEDLVKGGD